MVEQATTAQSTPPPPFENLLNTSSLPSQDEGYGHGITLDSMIATPRVSILIEDSTDVGTEKEIETLEETPQEFDANAPLRDKVGFLK